MTHFVHATLGDIVVPIPDEQFDPMNWPKGGAYPLFPFHNRVANACFTHEGERIDLIPHPALAGDAMHGPAHRQPWRGVSNSDDRAELALDYTPDEHWPFQFHASQIFHLNQNRLDITFKLTNTGTVTMPGGLGWHPYFAASLGVDVGCDAKSAWPLDEKSLPTNAQPEIRSKETLPDTAGYTHHFSQWSKANATLDGGARIVLTADQSLPHLAAHRMPSYICLEPVSHVAGALGLISEERKKRGIVVLQPGECLSASLSITVVGHARDAA